MPRQQSGVESGWSALAPNAEGTCITVQGAVCEVENDAGALHAPRGAGTGRGVQTVAGTRMRRGSRWWRRRRKGRRY